MKAYLVAILFGILASLVLLVPLTILFRLLVLPLLREADAEYSRNLTATTKAPALRFQNPFTKRKSKVEDIEMLPISNSSFQTIQEPPKAYVKPEGKQPQAQLHRQPRSQPPPHAAAVTATTLPEIPDTTAAAAAIATCDLNRSDTQKTNFSTASTVVTPEMRYDSIRTARSGPLPTVMPNENGYFDSAHVIPKRSELLGHASRGVEASATARERLRKVSESFSAHREKMSRARGPAYKLKEQLKAAKEKAVNEESDNVELCDEGVDVKDFAGAAEKSEVRVRGALSP